MTKLNTSTCTNRTFRHYDRSFFKTLVNMPISSTHIERAK